MDTVCRPTALDIRALFESIVHILPSEEDNTDVEFMVVIAPSVPQTLLLDETYIHRIFMNLLSNALKFTKVGYVLLTVDYINNELIASVKDTGVGIPQIFLPRLFDPFSQAATQGSQRGTGLGLSIIKQLLHKMDGCVSVVSEYAERQSPDIRTGTSFMVTIPARPPSSGHILPDNTIPSDRIAMFAQEEPISQEGQTLAWEHFGLETVVIHSLSDLDQYPDIKHIWVDAKYLQHNPDSLKALLLQDRWDVLVPYTNQEILHHISSIMSTSQCVLLPKPLMWHTFPSRIAFASRSSPNALEVSIPDLRLLDVPDAQATLNSASKKEVTILLVEDNPVRPSPLGI